MTAIELDPVLAEGLAKLVPLDESARGDWSDVERRANARAARRRAPRLRLVLVALALVVAFALVAPALGIDLPVLDFWKAEKASPRVVEDFRSLTEGAPAGMDPEALPGEARKVTTAVLSDGPHTLWVAPTRAGGFCLTWTNASGGCDQLGTVPLSVTWMAAGPLPARELRPEPSRTSFTRVSGFANADYVHSIELRFADGDVVRPNVSWVSEPIGAGFFVYDLPQARRASGHELIAVVALDSNGQIVAEDTGRPSESTGSAPPEAIVDERTAIARIRTRHGEAVVWEAPTRYEGRCAWLEYEGRSLAFVPCMPKGYPFGAFAFRFVPTADDVLLVGWVRNDVASVEVTFADGDRIVAHPQDGFVLVELPAEHLVRGREARTIVSRDILGRPLHAPFDVNGLGGGRYPCLAPLPLHGTRSGPFCL